MLRQELGRSGSYEFKFTETHDLPNVRQRFFEVALQFPFEFSVCCIDKTRGYWRRSPGRELHWAASTWVAVCMRDVYHRAERADRPLQEPIIVDRNDDGDFLAIVHRAFHTLRSRLHPDCPMTALPRFRKSHADAALQLADMICGAVGASLDGDRRWRKMLECRCAGVACLPE